MSLRSEIRFTWPAVVLKLPILWKKSRAVYILKPSVETQDVDALICIALVVCLGIYLLLEFCCLFPLTIPQKYQKFVVSSDLRMIHATHGYFLLT